MDLLPSIKSILAKYLEMVTSSATHQLSFEDRLILYRELGLHQTEEVLDQSTGKWHLVLSPAALVLGWLAVLTARKVLPLRQTPDLPAKGGDIYSSDPFEMLEVAENVLLEKITGDEAKDDLLYRFYYGMVGLDGQVKDIVCAAYGALETVVYGFESIKNNKKDFAGYAMSVSAPMDYSEEDSEIDLEELDLDPWDSFTDTIWKILLNEDFDKKFEKYSPEKSLTFWEWWLTDAVPQAFALA